MSKPSIPFSTTSSKVQPESLPVMLRGFVPLPPPPPETPKTGKKKKSPNAINKRKPTPPSEWTLIFDCETRIDASQSLRFRTYQVRKSEERMEAGIFYDIEILTESEREILRRVAIERRLELRTSDDFVENVFFGIAYEFRANIIGFNLPFDLSRLAIRYGSAKGKTMSGGFSLKLSSKPWRPPVQIRHLNSRAALMQFALPPRQRNSRGARRRKIFTPGRRGSFIDLKTIAAALFSRSFSLASLAEFLKTSSRKFETEAHGAALTEAYIGYALQDTQVTWECYEALAEKYALHQLSDTSLGKILSEASLGKAYLRQMGVKPFREVQPNFPPELLGVIMSAYFGGRSEVAWRREIKQVLYCDFLSMYPTVCTLMGLWRFVIAEGMSWRDATEETRALVEGLEVSQLQDPANWRNLATLTFGGAYAVLAYVAQQAVETYHWLTPTEMLDGLGMAETTPGPLIMVLQFVGFMAAFRSPGDLPPLLAGALGGLLATWVTFAPCFLWIFLGAPYIETVRQNKALSGALAAITATVVGVILNLAIWFAIHTLFHKTVAMEGYGLSFDAPVLSSVNFWSLVLSVAAASAIFRFRVGILQTLAGSCLAGMGLFLVGAI
jgi:chromate transport protein ChrA